MGGKAAGFAEGANSALQATDRHTRHTRARLAEGRESRIMGVYAKGPSEVAVRVIEGEHASALQMNLRGARDAETGPDKGARK